MAFNLNEIKKNLNLDKLKSLFKKNPANSEKKVIPVKKPSAKPKSAALAGFQRGLQDIQAVFQEGKVVLFVKQFVVLLIVFLLVFYANKSLKAHQDKIKDEMSKIGLEQKYRDEYLANKEHLIKLEMLFPDISKKQDWLVVRLKDIFEKRKMQVVMEGNAGEETQTDYVIGEQPVTFKAGFKEVGKLLADIENGDDFLRITDLTLTKLTDTENLGFNNVSIQFGTVFPKNKYAPTLFRDYAKQVEKLKPQTKPAAAGTTTEKTNA